MKISAVPQRVALAALLLPALAPVHAAFAASPSESWAGVDTVNGRPSSIRVTPTQDKGRDALDIAFGQPRDCRVQARVTERGAASSRYEVTATTAGRYCSAWIPGQVVLERDDAQARLQITGEADDVSAVLWAVGQAPQTLTVPTALDGTWSTTVQSRAGKPVTARLQLVGRDPGDAGGTFAYGSPRSCQVPLRYEGSTAEGAWYALRSGGAGGAACDALVGQWLVVQPNGDAATLRFEPANAECAPSCRLSRPQP